MVVGNSSIMDSSRNLSNFSNHNINRSRIKMTITPTLGTDGYKIDHRRQYVPETRMVVSNGTPRKSRVEGVNAVVVFGIQAYVIGTLIEIWNKEFFQANIDDITEEFMEEMAEYTMSRKFAEDIGVEHWRALHKLGYLPLEIKSLPEGSLCPIRVPAFTVRNTHDDFYWLTNFIETDMSSETWMPSTSATTAYHYRKIFTRYAELTGTPLAFVGFQGHDFSYRGMPGRQAAQLSGAGHLTSFYGTDTIPAIKWLKKYYKAKATPLIPIGCSVFATEHAVMCVSTGFYIRKKDLTWEKYGEAEFEVFKRLITELYPTGIVSIVSDTWDLWKVLVEYLVRLKSEIMARDGKVVIRPDSGDPVDILCGVNSNPRTADTIMDYSKCSQAYRDQVSEPEHKGVIELLWEVFGGTITSTGHKMLDPHIGAIYGDSITTARATQICERLMKKGFASGNWVAGIGSYTYQYVTRDTYGWAIKATYAEVDLDGERIGIEIFKDPITDDGTKKSAKGLIQVNEIMEQDSYGKLHHKTYELHDQATWEEFHNSALQTIFLNGVLVKETTLEQIRQRITTQQKFEEAKSFSYLQV
jgi:nicotinamide phosphoribosyltransferase